MSYLESKSGSISILQPSSPAVSPRPCNARVASVVSIEFQFFVAQGAQNHDGVGLEQTVWQNSKIVFDGVEG